MTTQLAIASTTKPDEDSSSVSANSAVARCVAAWAQAGNASKAAGNGQVFIGLAAGEAYRRAMPVLSGAANIRDFIACTAHGMLIGAIEGPDGARLLYVAQVAQGAHHSQPAKQKTAAA